MKDEVFHATEFIVGFVRKANVPSSVVERFRKRLVDCMTKKYRDHWHPEKPHRGNAYRSITIDSTCCDPLIYEVLRDLSLDSHLTQEIKSALPKDVVLWVDPMDVSYRFGDHGSIGILFAGSQSGETSDYESGSSSVSSSPCSSPPSPSEYWQQSPHSIHHQCGHEAFLNSPFPNHHYNGMQTTVA